MVQRNEQHATARRCIGCGVGIEACMGFGIARDIEANRRPVRELCGRCVERAARDHDWFLLKLKD